jgi:acetate---CoA ligase (ADP-forming)
MSAGQHRPAGQPRPDGQPRPAGALESGADGLAALFAPRGIAVIGASRTPGKLGAVLARSLSGFAAGGGHLALVNPRDDGLYPTVRAAAADGPVDLAIICLPAAACPAALAEAAAAGAAAAVVCGGGFAEAGGPGRGYQEKLAAVAAETGIRLLGPNTSGFLVPRAQLTVSFVPGVTDVRPGSVAVVAASGGVNHALAFLLTEAGHGISLAVGLGNAADVSAPDVLRYLDRDPATTAVALHVESVADGPRLVAAVRQLAASRPVAALVVGQHDIGAFAASHTGALATSWRATRAALAQAGAVLVDDERELVDAVGALSVTRARPGRDPGTGVVTAQAGPGLLILDQLRGRGARVPELTRPTRDALAELLPPLTFQANPVDTGRPGPSFGQVLSVVAADPQIDVIAGYALHEPDAVDLVAAAVGALLADARNQARLAGADQDRLSAGDRSGRPAVPLGVAGPHDENQAKDLLGQLGMATPPRRACASRDAAQAALAELGGPVAVKILDARVLHKTDIGGVVLGVSTPGELDAALGRLQAAGAERYLVEKMAPPGIDLVLGARRDPVFGPLLLLGLGGITAEALADVTIRLAPLSPAEAALMPAELAGRALLDGWRGGPVLDPAEFGRTATALGDLLAANPGIGEIEVNPLRLTAGGLVALDAVVVPWEAGDAQPDQ